MITFSRLVPRSGRLVGALGAAAAVTATVVVSLAAPAPVGAGGWVVVTLDSGVELRAGTAGEVGFTVLRHGITPETWDEGLELVVDTGDGAPVRFAAVGSGAPGHHVATVELPEAGRYDVVVRADPAVGGLSMSDPVLTLDVDAAAAPGGGRAVWDVAPAAAGIGAAALVAAAIPGARRRRRDVATTMGTTGTTETTGPAAADRPR